MIILQGDRGEAGEQVSKEDRNDLFSIWVLDIFPYLILFWKRVYVGSKVQKETKEKQE